jgi:hypothetical protein
VDESAQHVVTFFYTYKYHKKQRGQLGGQTKSNETEPDFLLLPFLSSHARPQVQWSCITEELKQKENKEQVGYRHKRMKHRAEAHPQPN